MRKDLPDDYLMLAAFCPISGAADDAAVERIAEFVGEHAGKGTLRNQDTLARMQEALDGIRGVRASSVAQ